MKHRHFLGVDLEQFRFVLNIHINVTLVVANRKFGLAADRNRAKKLAVGSVEHSAVSAAAIENKNINVVSIKPEKDKNSRVIAQTDLIEGGSVFLPEKAEWRDVFLKELLEFPGGRHDDQVDAFVQGLAYQRGQWLRKIVVRPTTGY